MQQRLSDLPLILSGMCDTAEHGCNSKNSNFLQILIAREQSRPSNLIVSLPQKKSHIHLLQLCILFTFCIVEHTHSEWFCVSITSKYIPGRTLSHLQSYFDVSEMDNCKDRTDLENVPLDISSNRNTFFQLQGDYKAPSQASTTSKVFPKLTSHSIFKWLMRGSSSNMYFGEWRSQSNQSTLSTDELNIAFHRLHSYYISIFFFNRHHQLMQIPDLDILEVIRRPICISIDKKDISGSAIQSTSVCAAGSGFVVLQFK